MASWQGIAAGAVGVLAIAAELADDMLGAFKEPVVYGLVAVAVFMLAWAGVKWLRERRRPSREIVYDEPQFISRNPFDEDSSTVRMPEAVQYAYDELCDTKAGVVADGLFRRFGNDPREYFMQLLADNLQVSGKRLPSTRVQLIGRGNLIGGSFDAGGSAYRIKDRNLVYADLQVDRSDLEAFVKKWAKEHGGR